MSKPHVETVMGGDGRSRLSEVCIARLAIPYFAHQRLPRRRGKQVATWTTCGVCGNPSRTNPCHKCRSIEA